MAARFHILARNVQFDVKDTEIITIITETWQKCPYLSDKRQIWHKGQLKSVCGLFWSILTI